MTAPVIASQGTPIIRDCWRGAPQGIRLWNVTSCRDVDGEAGFEPVIESQFDSRYAAEAYIEKWQDTYPDRVYFIN